MRKRTGGTKDSPENLRVDQVLVSRRIGGAALIAIQLAQLVRTHGGESRAWTPGPGPAAAQLAEASIPWRRYGLDSMTANPILHGLACLRMAGGLLGHRRLVHVHTPRVYRLIRPALRLARVRTIVHVHIEPSADDIHWAFQDPPDLVVTCAEYLVHPVRKALQASGRTVPVLAIPNPVDLDRFSPGDRAAAKAAIGARTDRPLLLMLANLAPHKGQVTALHATGLMRQRGMMVDCWLAGEERDPDAGFRAELDRLTHQLGISDNVRFLGFRSDGPNLLQAADILLLPSTHEGLPVSILEAQATRTAVIASPEPGIREIIQDQVTGFLVAPADHQGYADRILTLVTRPRLYEQVVARACDCVTQRHSRQTFADHMLQLYKLVITAIPDGSAVSPDIYCKNQTSHLRFR